VLDAYLANFGWQDRPLQRDYQGVAAVLRAAADQVVPKLRMIVEGGRTYEEAWTATVHADIRRRFLAIADDLEDHQ
jgi:hypothetical protein